MRPLDHREPGILGTALTNDDLFAEVICDGIHVAPEMVKLWWRAKGPERAILVTDALSAVGMPDGVYHLGDFAVQVANGRATANGVLAGSAGAGVAAAHRESGFDDRVRRFGWFSRLGPTRQSGGLGWSGEPGWLGCEWRAAFVRRLGEIVDIFGHHDPIAPLTKSFRKSLRIRIFCGFWRSRKPTGAKSPRKTSSQLTFHGQLG
jgi:hypothetical protein